MNTSIPRPEYPRPDFERRDWLNLNGEWKFEFDDDNLGEKNKWYEAGNFTRKIVVPFCYQSKLSGIEEKGIHDFVWYKRSFELPKEFSGKSVMLNIGSSDYYTKVWVNGSFVGEHKGGYTPFGFDITSAVKATENIIVIRVEDSSRNTSQLRGKQTWTKDNFGCWYTRVTGIWQTVWLEALSAAYIERVKITPDRDKKEVGFEIFLKGDIQDCFIDTDISYEGISIAKASQQIKRSLHSFSINISSDNFEWSIMTWEPDNPNLYDVSFKLSKCEQMLDEVKSYFGMRKISTRNGKVLLNNLPIYQRLILDQGYFDGGLLTAASDEDYIRDIKAIKELGFNGVRKHQKVEDPRFLYWADKLGLLVWGEMASAYEFNDLMMTENLMAWQQTIARDYNHPSIIVWTLMNESWGVQDILINERQQNHTLSLYHMVKAYDNTRLVISNDGWEHTCSDITTFHDYTQDGGLLKKRLEDKNTIVSDAVCSIGDQLNVKYLYAQGFHYNGEPILISECCGVAFDSKDGWGYGSKVKSNQEYLERYKDLLKAVYDTDYLVGFCITQLTDVEQEKNGILTMDRKPKVEPSEFARIIKNII